MFRIIAIILFLSLSSCIEVGKGYNSVIIEDSKEKYDSAQSNDQFESKDLSDIKHHKKRLKIALLLPMSGKNKSLGESLFNSATLSLFDNDQDNDIELILFDSMAAESNIKKTFKSIIDQNIKIVIGPIFSDEVEKIADDVIKNNIIMISLSNNQKLLGNVGDNAAIFVAGMVPEVKIDKIVSFALSQGKSSFAVIAPNNQYGIVSAAIYKKMVKDRDAVFVTSELYSPNGNGVGNAVKRAVNAFSVPSNVAEGGGNILQEDFIVEDIEKTHAQIILVPDSGRRLSKIVKKINEENINNRDIKIVGTSQWDNILTLGDPYLIGGWFAAPNNEKFREFERKYYQIFTKFPPRMSSIIYDSILSITNIISKKNGIDVKLQDFIAYKTNELNGFSGIDGAFRYLSNGLVQRNLAILEVGQGRFEVIEAPDPDFML